MTNYTAVHVLAMEMAAGSRLTGAPFDWSVKDFSTNVEVLFCPYKINPIKTNISVDRNTLKWYHWTYRTENFNLRCNLLYFQSTMILHIIHNHSYILLME